MARKAEINVTTWVGFVSVRGLPVLRDYAAFSLHIERTSGGLGRGANSCLWIIFVVQDAPTAKIFVARGSTSSRAYVEQHLPHTHLSPAGTSWTSPTRLQRNKEDTTLPARCEAGVKAYRTRGSGAGNHGCRRTVVPSVSSSRRPVRAGLSEASPSNGSGGSNPRAKPRQLPQRLRGADVHESHRAFRGGARAGHDGLVVRNTYVWYVGAYRTRKA